MDKNGDFVPEVSILKIVLKKSECTVNDFQFLFNGSREYSYQCARRYANKLVLAKVLKCEKKDSRLKFSVNGSFRLFLRNNF